MNITAVGIGFVTKGSLKKQLLLVLATMTIVISLPFAAVFAMGEDVVTFLSGVPNIAAAETQGFYMGGPVEGDTYEWGNCTYWAFAMRLWAGYPIPTTWGNADTWDDRAIADGYEVNRIPADGAIYQTDAGRWGHVAYVIDVNPTNGQWTISEMNVAGLNMVGKRTFSKESAAFANFIHDKKGAPAWNPQPISAP